MKRRVLPEVFKSVASILDTSDAVCRFNINGKKKAGCVLKPYGQGKTGLKIVRYRKVRYYRINKERWGFVAFKRDMATHLLRLAIVRDDGNSILDDLLFVSDFYRGTAVACRANGDLVLLNERGQIIWRICKRREAMKFIKIAEKSQV